MSQQKAEALTHFNITNGEILSAAWHDAAEKIHFAGIDFHGTKAWYSMDLMLHAEPGSSIRVSLGLPVENAWNGKLLGLGNGGAAGQTNEICLIRGLCLGFATVHTAMGSPETDPTEAVGNRIVIRDFGYRSTHLMTLCAKEIMKQFYGRSPEHSYFFGSSTGGNQALSEAQRYPEDYDGILAFCPAHRRIDLHTQFLYNAALSKKGGKPVFTKEELEAVTDRLIDEYAERCGSNPEDRFLAYPDRIGEVNMAIFRDLKMRCPLNEEQTDILKKIYQGPKDPVTGRQIFPGYTVGAETQGIGLMDMMYEKHFLRDYMFPFYWGFGEMPDIDAFDFHKDYLRAKEELGPLMDAENPDLTAFRQRGGKLILVHGTSDAAIACQSSVEYWKAVTKQDGSPNKTKEYFRFFLVPGFAHSIGGPGFQEMGSLSPAAVPQDELHDPILALDAWAVRGNAPDMLIASGFKAGELFKTVERERPVYPYPACTVYLSGDRNRWTSYGIANENDDS